MDTFGAFEAPSSVLVRMERASYRWVSKLIAAFPSASARCLNIEVMQ